MYIDPRYQFDAAASPADIALFNGAAVGFADQVAEALAQGANVNVADIRYKSTPLHMVAAYNAIAALRVLIKHPDLDYTALDYRNRPPATLAYEVGENPLVGRFLIKKERLQHQARGTQMVHPSMFLPAPRANM